MIKTAIENRQNLIVEGCCIPFQWKDDFADQYLREIRYYCLVLSRNYIENHFSDIKKYANEIEQRLDDSWCTVNTVLEDNLHYLEMCQIYGCNYILIDDSYQVELNL